MLHPTMKITEIIPQVKRDYEKIVHSTIIRLGNEYDRERQKLKIDKKRTYSRIYNIKTAAKNNWMIVVGKKPSSEYYKSPGESLTYDPFAYYYDQSGLKVLKWSNPILQMFTSHFFQRYNERLNLGFTTSVDSAKHFILHNCFISYQLLIKKGMFSTIGFAKEGLLLGNLQADNWVLWRTFVSGNLIHPAQSKMKQQLVTKLDVQWIKAMKENKTDTPLGWNTYSQLEMLKGKYNPF
jgi:hypothetical protein